MIQLKYSEVIASNCLFLLTEAVMKIHKDKNVQPSEVNKIIGLNLAYAKDRMAGRKKSSERKNVSDDVATSEIVDTIATSE